MQASSFAMHSRSECAIHRWDMIGDDDVSQQLLSQPEITEHAVNLLGPLLLSRGCASGAAPAAPCSVRLRSTGQQDIIVRHDDGGAVLTMEPDDGSPAIEADAAARLLLIWGRRPADTSRIRSSVSPAEMHHVRSLLAGG